MAGAFGIDRFPGGDPRLRRLLDRLTKTASWLTGIVDGETISSSGGELSVIAQDPIFTDASGVGLDYGTGLTLSGTSLIVDNTAYVPYTGATTNVNLGAFNLTAEDGIFNGDISAQDCTLTESLILSDTTASDDGVIYKGSDRFLHNFHHPTGDTAVPTGNNTFLGINTGNFTMGSTATLTNHSSDNTGVGYNVLGALTKGFKNTAIGGFALTNLTTGSGLVAIGSSSGAVLTTATNGVYIGRNCNGSANNETNAIVIGDSATGQGSNTSVIGNAAITDAYIFGNTLHLYGKIDADASYWWDRVDVDIFIADPGASGATFTVPDGNTVGGFQLDNATEYLYVNTHMHENWDGASDLVLEIQFEINVDNSGGNAGDTVDFDVEVYLKGDGDTATKNQSISASKTVGAAAQYTAFTVEVPVDYDHATDPVDTDDRITFVINLDTADSEVDDIIVNHMEFKWKTNQLMEEV